jgi:hypothetical protein
MSPVKGSFWLVTELWYVVHEVLTVKDTTLNEPACGSKGLVAVAPVLSDGDVDVDVVDGEPAPGPPAPGPLFGCNLLAWL